MTARDESAGKSPDGFRGEVAGLGLGDVIQLNVLNRFSGCISVQYLESNGLIFFRDGQIIHAEEGRKVGDEAFYRILGWPEGQFSLKPNVATTRSTIQKGWQHLILEAHRLMDEQRAGRTESPQRSPEPAPARPAAGDTLIDRVRRVPGVTYAVIQGKDGTRAGDDGYEAEASAGQAAYLMMMGSQLGAVFRAGDLQRAAVQGTTQHMLLLANRSHYLGVLIGAGSQVGAVESEVKKALASGR